MKPSGGVPASFINTIFKEDASIPLPFEQYTLKSLLGSGGLGVVVKANKASGIPVALKFLYTQNRGWSSDIMERFKQEIKSTKMVGDISDSCVRVYECGEYPLSRVRRVPFFAMEYIPGLSLEDFILLKETPFTPQEIFVVARQIAAALEDIHDKGIVHRDIKPSNILFHETRRILKVTDFGISRDLVANTGVTMAATDGRPIILGTLNYLSRYYFDTIFVDESDVRQADDGKHVRVSTGEPVHVDTEGRYYCAYKGKKLDLSVLASTILFELTSRVNPLAGSTFPAIITDIMSGNRHDIRTLYREQPERFHDHIRRREGFLSHIDKIIRKGAAVPRNRTYASARELIGDLERAIKAFRGKVPSPRETDETMANLLGKALVDEYEHVLRRIERATREGSLTEDRDNGSRIALLYKLKKTDRLSACIELHHAKSLELTKAKRPPRRECAFYADLWERLERLGIDDPYRQNAATLQKAVKRSAPEGNGL